MCDLFRINWKGGKEFTEGLPFHTPIASSFLHAEQVCLLAEAIASWSARYSRRIVARDTSSIRLYASDYNNLCKGISHSVGNSSR